jgi:hypothetical protein
MYALAATHRATAVLIFALAGSHVWAQSPRVPKWSTQFHSTLRIHEEKQTDVMLGCLLVTDAALGLSGSQASLSIQVAPHHRSNTRPRPSPCQAANVSLLMAVQSMSSDRRLKWNAASREVEKA